MLIVGTIAIAANLLNILIFWTNRELRSNYIFVIALDFGEIVNGLSYILTGFGRGTQAVMGRFQTPISVHNCFYTVRTNGGPNSKEKSALGDKKVLVEFAPNRSETFLRLELE